MKQIPLQRNTSLPSRVTKAPVNKIKPLFLAWLIALLIGLGGNGLLFADGDGGDGGDGGGDDVGMDDGGDGQDDGMDHDGGGHHGGHDGHGGHHGQHGGHHHNHIVYGGWGPGFYPGYGFGAFGYFPPYYPAFYGYPRVAVQPAAPPVYIEQQNPPTSAASTSQPAARYWHYCQGEGGYYPDVKECPEGWMQVAPQAQSAGTEPEQQ